MMINSPPVANLIIILVAQFCSNWNEERAQRVNPNGVKCIINVSIIRMTYAAITDQGRADMKVTVPPAFKMTQTWGSHCGTRSN